MHTGLLGHLEVCPAGDRGARVLSCRSWLREHARSSSRTTGSVLNAGKPENRSAPGAARSDDRDEHGRTACSSLEYQGEHRVSEETGEHAQARGF